MLSLAKHLATHRERPFAALRVTTRTPPIFVTYTVDREDPSLRWTPGSRISYFWKYWNRYRACHDRGNHPAAGGPGCALCLVD